MATDAISVLNLLCSDIQLFDAERRISDFVLAHSEEAVTLTLSALARESGTSEATVSRFCKRIGFDSYRKFQLSLARDISERSAPGLTNNEVSLNDVRESLNNILAVKISEATNTIAGLKDEEVASVVDILRRARLVEVAATGNTIPVAMDAAFKFNQLGIRAVTSEIFEKSAAFTLTLSREDALLLISNSGRSQHLQTLARTARELGVPTILITGREQSPLSEYADHTLLTVNRERVLASTELPLSRTSATIVVEALYHFLHSCMPEAAPAVSRHKAISSSDKTMD